MFVQSHMERVQKHFEQDLIKSPAYNCFLEKLLISDKSIHQSYFEKAANRFVRIVYLKQPIKGKHRRK